MQPSNSVSNVLLKKAVIKNANSISLNAAVSNTIADLYHVLHRSVDEAQYNWLMHVLIQADEENGGLLVVSRTRINV